MIIGSVKIKAYGLLAMTVQSLQKVKAIMIGPSVGLSVRFMSFHLTRATKKLLLARLEAILKLR